MKRAYQKPEVIDVTICGEIVMLRASESTRNLGGGVTEKVDGEKVLPPKIYEYDGQVDPYAGRGQGDGGSGNRSKVWDEVDEDF
jgi:hypothetical protein